MGKPRQDKDEENKDRDHSSESNFDPDDEEDNRAEVDPEPVTKRHPGKTAGISTNEAFKVSI